MALVNHKKMIIDDEKDLLSKDDDNSMDLGKKSFHDLSQVRLLSTLKSSLYSINKIKQIFGK